MLRKLDITTSMAMLPFSIAVAVLLWITYTPVVPEKVAGLALALLTTLTVRWVSNTLQLIRIRSWAVSSVFILLIAATAPLHQWELVPMGLCMLYAVHLAGMLFSTYGSRPHVSVFISIIALACMAMIQPLTLWLLPVCLIAMLLPLRVWSGRTASAILLGLLLPFQIWLCWQLMNGTLAESADGIIAILTTPPSGWEQLSIPYSQFAIPNGFCLLFIVYCLIANIHFLRTSLDDKMSTRMHYISILLQWPVVLALFLLWQPCSANLVAVMALCSAPLMARYFVFSRGWAGVLMFWLFVLYLLFVCICPSIF